MDQIRPEPVLDALLELVELVECKSRVSVQERERGDDARSTVRPFAGVQRDPGLG
jgi:hypothetical protein